MARNLNLPIYTYEFMPIRKENEPQFFVGKNADEIRTTNQELMARKQDIFQDILNQLVEGKIIPQLDDKQYRCKTIYHQGGIVIFKMENIKDETFPWNFATASHKIGPNCHIIIDNRKDMQHIAIERNPKAFSSTNQVKNILQATFLPLMKAQGLSISICQQYQPDEFWDFIDAHRMVGIREVRFYFPFPNLPAISDKYGDFMKQLGLDYHCMPGMILYAPDDLDMILDRNDLGLDFYVKAAGESGIPIAVKTKAKGARTMMIGKKSSVTWPLDKSLLYSLDPAPDSAHTQQTQLEFMQEDEKAKVDGAITEFVNRGRFMVNNTKAE